MHKHLDVYLQQVNRFNRIFGKPQYAAANLTALDRAELLDRLECELSPENLCCDGELRGEALRAKTTLLKGAKAELQRLQAGGTYK